MDDQLREHLMEHNPALIPDPAPRKSHRVTVQQAMALMAVLMMSGVSLDPEEEKRPG